MEVKFINVPVGTFDRLKEIAHIYNLTLPSLKIKSNWITMESEEFHEIVKSLQPYSACEGIAAIIAELYYYYDSSPVVAWII